MEFKSKKGFITIYVMLAMMFFVVFVVTASVIASRKIKLQAEANTALYDIYSQNINGIVQDEETTIPIYTQAQFIQIANWINNSSRANEYIYVNDTVYLLDSSKFEPDADGKYILNFILKTDLWFDGKIHTEPGYPYIPNDPNNVYHKALKEMKDRNADYKQGHTIYLKVDGKNYLYDDDTIKITNGEEFLKIGTNEWVNGICYLPTMTYEIQNTIKIKESDYTGVKWENRPVFEGTITTKDNNQFIIDGLNINLSDLTDVEDASDGYKNIGLFSINNGEIKNLIFTNVNLKTGEEKLKVNNIGIITGINNGTIQNCEIQPSDFQTNYNSITGNFGANTFTDTTTEDDNIALGGITGKNSGTIDNCKVKKLKIKEIYAEVRNNSWKK